MARQETCLAKDRGDLAKFFYKLKHHLDRHPDDKLEIHAEVYQRKQTKKQTSALHGHAYKIIREETGNDIDDIHEFFCGLIFGTKEKQVLKGPMKIVPVRTTTINEQGIRDPIKTLEAMDFFEYVRGWAAAHLGIQIPDPDPDWKKRQRELKQENTPRQGT